MKRRSCFHSRFFGIHSAVSLAWRDTIEQGLRPLLISTGASSGCFQVAFVNNFASGRLQTNIEQVEVAQLQVSRVICC